MEEDLENLTENESLIGGNEIHEAKKNKAALVAAILGLISGVCFIAFSVLFFAGLMNFDTSSVPKEKQGGAVTTAIIVILLFMIPITAIGAISGLLEIGRSAVYFTQVGGERKSKTGVLIAFTIIKALYCALSGYGVL
ncbi:MAG: hypothetical protein J5836_03040, partial [Clostridia bacterium]|nr:hypothetical protein [Clostridia bacterium]